MSYFFSRAPLALVIGTRASPNITIKHKKTELFIRHYTAFQEYAADILAPPLRTFHAPQFKLKFSKDARQRKEITLLCMKQLTGWNVQRARN